MGKRRIRCLNSIGEFEIYGFDTNKIRLKNVYSEFNLKGINNLEKKPNLLTYLKKYIQTRILPKQF
jgi:hypothetical protein